MSALSVTNLSRSFGGVRALSDVSFEVEAHERRLIIGPNGAGKTTLFNLLSGAAAVSTGQINLFGQDITYLEPYERARMGLSRTFQITNLFPRLTVLQNVVLALQSIEGGASESSATHCNQSAALQQSELLVDRGWAFSTRKHRGTKYLVW